MSLVECIHSSSPAPIIRFFGELVGLRDYSIVSITNALGGALDGSVYKENDATWLQIGLGISNRLLGVMPSLTLVSTSVKLCGEEMP